jgi:ribonucleoside-triphosphate reductase
LARFRLHTPTFPFLDDKWRKVTEEEALIGVSFTGIADAGNRVPGGLLRSAAYAAVATNVETAYAIGINPAARVTTGKPEGSSSAVLGTSSGLHARKGSVDRTYLRRVRLKGNTPLTGYLLSEVPGLMEQNKMDPENLIISIPQMAPEGALMYDSEMAMDTFNRAMLYNQHWVEPGHVSGENRNNMSCTIDVRDNEWDGLGQAMWENRDLYNGLSILPYDGGSYVQAPFEGAI